MSDRAPRHSLELPKSQPETDQRAVKGPHKIFVPQARVACISETVPSLYASNGRMLMLFLLNENRGFHKMWNDTVSSGYECFA